jgi:hypothetical protein
MKNKLQGYWLKCRSKSAGHQSWNKSLNLLHYKQSRNRYLK